MMMNADVFSLGQPSNPSPTAIPFNGSASKAQGTVGWGMYVCSHMNATVLDHWDPD